ncbi:hypothetical protein OA84_00185 [Kaistella solincola]|uniref:Glycosyltransferase 2-like domain-containing protein n=2 Tax=Kaistella solincola TaxID=510955 RepID=A0ABR4ZTQ0_9FLAO|nr:hypothetical protein OA84_00185 [Kaistella solincola]
MESKLAIIIPFYKEKYFRSTLESLKNQSNRNFSVYIGNDNSPEKIDGLLTEFSDFTNFKYEKFKGNLGGENLVSQWDRCIALSENEEFLMILGDDDVLEKNVVEEFYNFIEKANYFDINVIRFASQLIDENGSIISDVYENPEIEKAADSFMRIIKGAGRSSLSEHVFSRKAYEKHGFKNFPVAFGSDNVAWLEFPEMGNIYSINSAKVLVRISGEHLSSSKDSGLALKRKEGIHLFTKYIIENYSAYFKHEDLILILKKSYRNLRYFSRDKLRTLKFINLMFRKIGFSAFSIVRENRFN